MKRYLIHSEKLGYWQSIVGKAFFGDSIEDANWYKSERTAITAISDIRGFDTGPMKVIGIEVAVELSKDPCNLHDDLLARSVEMLKELDTMSNAEVEGMSETRWRQYKRARTYVREHGHTS